MDIPRRIVESCRHHGALSFRPFGKELVSVDFLPFHTHATMTLQGALRVHRSRVRTAPLRTLQASQNTRPPTELRFRAVSWRAAPRYVLRARPALRAPRHSRYLRLTHGQAGRTR